MPGYAPGALHPRSHVRSSSVARRVPGVPRHALIRRVVADLKPATNDARERGGRPKRPRRGPSCGGARRRGARPCAPTPCAPFLRAAHSVDLGKELPPVCRNLCGRPPTPFAEGAHQQSAHPGWDPPCRTSSDLRQGTVCSTISLDSDPAAGRKLQRFVSE
jgi:hypothetical protein